MASPSSSKPVTKKDLILHSNNEQSYIEVCSHHTLSDVRQLILDELDPEQLPHEQFSFRINNIRISEKQELKKLAFHFIENDFKVELVAKRGSKRAAPEDNLEREIKRSRSDESGIVTPNEGKHAEENRQDDSEKTVDKTERENNSMIPIDLDDKFADRKDGAEEDGYLSFSEFTADAEAQNKDEDAEEIEASLGVEHVAAATQSNNGHVDSSKNGANHMEIDDVDKCSGGTNFAKFTTNDVAKEPKTRGEEVEKSDEVVELVMDQNPHKEADEAKGKSNQVLAELKKILHDNPDFCTDDRRNELLEDIKEIAESSTPRTVFGVLGNTGVGKSSLLNSLLEEASVLPTSGSRGCTAAVVELVFNSALVKQSTCPNEKVPVYRGEVEFITLADWQKELKILVEECSTQEKTIYLVPPNADAQPDAAAAWQKIEQVYGRGSMDRFLGRSTENVFNVLANDLQVKTLLASTEPGKEYNSIIVNVGEVTTGSEEVNELLKPFSQMKRKTKTSKKKWATEFRSQINNYVYRKGNGYERQTWPLIHKVELRGPWHVLSTGACLVDLPGVRDSNAARAKVAERYLQNCNHIAIVASIKRAVDDGTAKELMGEQFKRRLLMDGNYGNVFFICTQTDDLETTETMRDHQDIAEEVEGRWEKMQDLSKKIATLETRINQKQSEKEELESVIDDIKQDIKDSRGELKEAEKEAEDCEEDGDDYDEELVPQLKACIASKENDLEHAKVSLKKWEESNQDLVDADQAKCDGLQKKLKALCAAVRNEYSKRCLQEDFKSGLRELYRKDDDEEGGTNEEANTAIPGEFALDVFCISANDYLKVMNIKPRRDGPPNTFASATQTEIPQLRSYVHSCTSRFSKSSVKTFVEHTNDVLDRIKLIAGDVDEVPAGRSAFRMKGVFQSSMSNLAASIEPICANFKKELDQKIEQNLASSLKTGALRGGQEALSTVHSWGSKNRRTKHERAPDKNGLYWGTYNAVARRDGVYTSPTVGLVDFNQELCDPMEKEFSTEWQAVLDSTIRRLLNDAEKKILGLVTTACQSFANNLRENGVDAGRLASMLNTANRSAISGLKSAFHRMQVLAVDSQRELSRELLPSVKEKMLSTYDACVNVQRGTGRFERMKSTMVYSSQRAISGMFDSASAMLLTGIRELVDRLRGMISETNEVISKAIDSVFSILWDNAKNDSAQLMDPAMIQRTRNCRNSLLPALNNLVDIQSEVCKLVGVERQDIELDVLGVETFEQSLERKMKEAKTKGAMFDLSSDSYEENIPNVYTVRVKAEKIAHSIMQKGGSQVDVIDLCDSDDEEDVTKPAAKRTTGIAVKEEGCMVI